MLRQKPPAKKLDHLVSLDNVQDIMAKFRSHLKSQYIPDNIVVTRSQSKKKEPKGEDQDI
jgi:hypothetical protein